ncbi:MAG TPA: hypothetical protein VH087_16060 [Thermoanaerobaculia bacterium]|nr:hypothetical protein [Thermoanaerobaculia bacterium]
MRRRLRNHVSNLLGDRPRASRVNGRRRTDGVQKTLPRRRRLAHLEGRRPSPHLELTVIHNDGIKVAVGQHALIARGTNRRPDVLTLFELLLKPGTGATQLDVGTTDIEDDLVRVLSADVRLDETFVGTMNLKYAALEVIRVAETDDSAPEYVSKALFGPHEDYAFTA